MDQSLENGFAMLNSLMKYDPATQLWKTSQLSLFVGSTEFSGPWPRSGMMRNGVVFPAQPWVPPISETDYGLSHIPRVKHLQPSNHFFEREPMIRLLPTPTARDHADLPQGKIWPAMLRRKQPSLATRSLIAGYSGHHLTAIYEWAMGLPVQHTALGSSEIASVLKSQS